MEFPLELEKTPEHSSVKGGLRTIPFIIANEVLEKVASSGLQANMIIYLTQEYGMGAATAASVMFICGALSDVIPMLGAFLADAYLGRFRMIALASISCLMGITLMWLTALLPGAKPPTCNISQQNCGSATPSQLTLLFAAVALIGIGSGGIRPCSIAFGADQFSHHKSPRREKILQAYFNWYYASVGISFMISVTVIVYIQDKIGWRVGFGVPVVLMALSAVLFLLGSPMYIKVKSHKSMLTGLAQVIVAAVRNRHFDLPKENVGSDQYHHGDSSNLMIPSDKLRFFNKACIIKDPGKDLRPDGVASNPWNLCTVEQVEDLKSVIRVIPLWSSGIMVSLVMSQHFPVLQASTMDRHLGRKFQVPASSLNVFQLITLTLWSGGYDRFIFPLLVKITGRPTGLSLKQRMGIGVLLSTVTTAVATAVEAMRRKTAIKEGVADDAAAVVSMSALWLVPQYSILGLAEAFNVIGQVEFYYSELPKSMNSFAVALWTLGLGGANLVGAFIVRLIDGVTGRDGRVSWLASDLNKGHYDYYYFILTLLGVGDVFYFLFCSWAYGEVGKKKPWEEGRDQVEEQLH